MKKINLIAVTLFAILVGVSTIFAQMDRGTGKAKDPIDIKMEKSVLPALGCCKCLDGSNTLDLSTVAGNPWTIDGNPVSIISPKHPSWDKVTGAAAWVSSSTSWGTNFPAGDYKYQIKFFVPNCTIGQEVRLTGDAGADNSFKVFLDSDPNPISVCSGITCFKNSTVVPPFSTSIASTNTGNHVLTVVVHNEGGPSGMFVNARLTSKCSSKLTKDDKAEN